METNIQKQHRLDKKKWLESESVNMDLSGMMPYCNFCGFQRKDFTCPIEQIHREMNCLCAKAYNRKSKL